jgi:hypothetical protein
MTESIKDNLRSQVLQAEVDLWATRRTSRSVRFDWHDLRHATMEHNRNLAAFQLFVAEYEKEYGRSVQRV